MEAPDASGEGSVSGPERVRCCSRCRAIYRSDFMRCPTDGAEITEVEGDPLVGTTIGDHYLVDACVAEGAMGRVYRAHHARLERKQFAIKVLIGDQASTLAMRLRFAQEAEAASRLDHPNVVSVVDYGKSQSGLLYLVMDFVSGPTLSRIIATHGPIEQSRAVTMARGLCHGLAHAHERGLVHRDFKPDNVIVTPVEGREVPRILDFGLAIAEGPTENAARLTSVGVAVGTPVYAAPEQTSGGTIDHRADLFALGVTLYEMLAGVTPFVGNMAEILYLNATLDPPPIAERAPGAQVSPALERIVRKLTQRDPAKRFDSARDVLRALDDLGGMEDTARLLPDVSDALASRGVVPRLGKRRADALRDTEPPPFEALAPASASPPESTPATAAPAPRRGVPGPIAIGAGLLALVVVAAVMVWPRAKSADRAVSASVAADAAPAPTVATPEASAAAPVAPPMDAASVAPTSSGPERVPGARGRGGRGRGSRAAGGSAPPPDSLDSTDLPPPAPAIDTGVREVVVVPAPRPVDAGATALTPRRVPPIDAGAPQARVVGARVAIGKIDLNGSLSVSEVRRPVERALPAISACYLRAATRAGKSAAGTARVTLTIDETGEARGVKASGSPLPGLDGCIAGALSGFRTRSAPDVGTVTVTLDLTLQPEAP